MKNQLIRYQFSSDPRNSAVVKIFENRSAVVTGVAVFEARKKKTVASP